MFSSDCLCSRISNDFVVLLTVCIGGWIVARWIRDGLNFPSMAVSFSGNGCRRLESDGFLCKTSNGLLESSRENEVVLVLGDGGFFVVFDSFFVERSYISEDGMCVGGGVEFSLSSFVGHCTAGAVFLMLLVLSLQGREGVQNGD